MYSLDVLARGGYEELELQEVSLLFAHEHVVAEVSIFIFESEHLKNCFKPLFFVDHKYLVLGLALVEINGCLIISEVF